MNPFSRREDRLPLEEGTGRKNYRESLLRFLRFILYFTIDSSDKQIEIQDLFKGLFTTM